MKQLKFRNYQEFVLVSRNLKTIIRSVRTVHCTGRYWFTLIFIRCAQSIWISFLYSRLVLFPYSRPFCIFHSLLYCLSHSPCREKGPFRNTKKPFLLVAASNSSETGPCNFPGTPTYTQKSSHTRFHPQFCARKRFSSFSQPLDSTLHRALCLYFILLSLTLNFPPANHSFSSHSSTFIHTSFWRHFYSDFSPSFHSEPWTSKLSYCFLAKAE